MSSPTIYAGPTPDNLTCFPDGLRGRRQFVLWRGEDRPTSTGEVKLNKIPINPHDLTNADSTDLRTWGTLEDCVQALPLALQAWETSDPQAYRGGGIGFVFIEDDPYVGIDLDHCVDGTTGLIAYWAQVMVEELHSYTEITPSGTGLHILAEGSLPPKGRRKGAVEMYDERRFFTMTGWHVEDTPAVIEPRQPQIDALWCNLFGAQVGQQVWACDTHGTIMNPQPWAIVRIEAAPAGDPYAFFAETTTGYPLVRCEVVQGLQGQPGSTVVDDATVIEYAKGAANSAKLMQLVRGEWQQAGYDSPSEADAGFCTMLAFWTQDPAQIDRLFRLTSLMRPKWDEKHGALTIGARTIRFALAQQTDHYAGNWGGKFLVSPSVPFMGNGHASNGTTVSSMNGTHATPGLSWFSTPQRQKQLVITDLADMLERTYPVPQWLIHDLIPEGLTFFVGSPKSSKTYLAYSLALSLAYEAQRGGLWLGHYPVTTPGPVVYVSLEDDEADSRYRIAELAPWLTTISRDRFLFVHGFELPRLHEGLLEALQEDIITPYHPALIVLDPISYLYAPTKKGADQFAEVKDMLLPLRWLGKEHHLSILGVDHRRKKSTDDVDIFETTYGSNAKIAIADSILMIIRDDKEITVHARVRKAEDQTMTLTFEFHADGTAQWTWKGSTKGLLQVGTYGDLRQKVLTALAASPVPLSIDDLLFACNIPESKQTRNSVKQVLWRAMKSLEVQKTTRNQYVWAAGN